MMFFIINANFFTNKTEGWHWYKDPPKKVKEHQDEMVDEKLLKTARQLLEEKLNIAVMNPTIENITTYQQEQKRWIENSAKFAINWQKALMLRPDLDNTVKNPTSYYGIDMKRKLDKSANEKFIQTLFKTHGLFFFFKGNCKFSDAFASIVKLFSQKYRCKVIAISVDGSKLKDFPDARHDNGIVSAWQVQRCPALFIVEPTKQQITPIAYSLISVDDIEERIVMQLKIEKE